VFLWEQGKFKQFLQLTQKREKNGYDSYFEAAMGMPIDRIVPLWQSYLNKIDVRRSEIMRLPTSMILPDKPAFQKFNEIYGIPVLPPGS
jgi:Zn-finger domain-containing protein